ncbi:MAG: hypothetical protein AAGI48_06905 [Verrucomicrobiota bacterium]
MRFFSSKVAAVIAAAVIVSCSNSVDLPVERRADARKIRVSGEIPRPEKIDYSSSGGNAAAFAGGLAGGLVGGMLVAAAVQASYQDEVELLEVMMGGRKGGATLTMKEEMERAIRRSSFTTLAGGSSARSTMNLEITSLGFMPVGGGNYQFMIEMEAELLGRDGVVIWSSYNGVYPHNEELPAGSLEEYRNDHARFRSDYRTCCRWVAEQLVDELKWQVEPEG